MGYPRELVGTHGCADYVQGLVSSGHFVSVLQGGGGVGGVVGGQGVELVGVC